MARRVAIIQSSYIPWRGYFAMIARCDAFIFLDSVQFTRRDWRTRNRIKTATGPLWLSIPVQQRGNYHASIDTMQVADPDWARRHPRAIEASYRQAPHFAAVFPALRTAYAAVGCEPSLSVINRSLIRSILDLLTVNVPLVRDTEVLPRLMLDALSPTDRLVALAKAADADTYLSGPSARDYLETARFEAHGIGVEWMDYGSLPAYPQLWGAFDPAVSMVDTLLHLGPDAARASLYG